VKRAALTLAAVAALAASAGCSSKQQTATADASGKPGASASNADPEASLKEMTPDDVDARLAKNDATFHVYDANEEEVFKAGHVPTAKWMPFDKVTADQLPPSKSDLLVFYCANPH